MRKFIILAALLLSACSPAEKEVLTTSVDVDQSVVPALLADLNSLTNNSFPTEQMLELVATTPMDEELQERYIISFDGADEEVQVHVAREQVKWVHLYFSSTSKELVAAIEGSNEPYARVGED